MGLRQAVEDTANQISIIAEEYDVSGDYEGWVVRTDLISIQRQLLAILTASEFTHLQCQSTIPAGSGPDFTLLAATDNI